MVKWKKLNKKMAGALLAVTMLFTVSTTAFAYVDESAEASRTEITQTEQVADQEQKIRMLRKLAMHFPRLATEK